MLCLIPGWGAEIPHARCQNPKTLNRNNILTNLIKTIKMTHIKKKSLKKSLVKLRGMLKLLGQIKF